jgi:predicted dehydrogenase
LLQREDVDAVYMPLPTGLHEEWIRKTLDAGKHILVEKSFASDQHSAERLLQEAESKRLCVVENYLFPLHSQSQALRNIIASGEIGEVVLMRSTFCCPSFPSSNFRYDKALGGGALLDTGGYVLKAAQQFVDTDLTALTAWLGRDTATGVVLAGTISLLSGAGIPVQCYFGFDSFYQCSVEFLGTKGKLSAGRVFTPPPECRPTIRLEWQGCVEERTLSADNHYLNMWSYFAQVVATGEYAGEYAAIARQARYIEEVRRAADA